MLDDELTAWILGVDRRLVLINSMKKHTILKASDIAQETSRSTQNISHALKEFNDKGFIKCLNPDKVTWKRYIVTDTGKEVLKNLESNYI
jgi:predicted transcriptional regulator